MNDAEDCRLGRDPQDLEAAEWYLSLQAGEVVAEDLQRWNDWSRIPGNQRAFDGVGRVSQLAADLKGLLKVEEGSASPLQDFAGPENRPSIPEFRPAPRYLRKGFLVKSATWMAAAASLAAIVVLVTKVKWRATDASTVQVYETASAQHRILALADGSTVSLGAKTLLAVSFTEDRRSIVLERGEALFRVAQDPERPFTVAAGNGEITALGTVFNVRHDANRVVVTVTEGKVRVRQPEPTQNETAGDGGRRSSSHPARSATSVQTLAPGEQLMYRPEGALSTVQRIDPQAAIAWQEGRLQYKDEPLKYVAADVNRYIRKEITFSDPAAENFLYTGTVYQDRIDAWLEGLEDLYPVEVLESDAMRVLVRSKAERR